MSEKRPGPGRPKIELDWVEIDELLTYGCSGAEIAARIGVNPKTVYDGCLVEKGIPFSEYCVQKYAKGDALLKEQQYKKALGLTDVGDNTMLVWLGKNRLKQRDKQPEETDSNITIKVIDARNNSTQEISMPPISECSLDGDAGRV
jgi:hypothetical protein